MSNHSRMIILGGFWASGCGIIHSVPSEPPPPVPVPERFAADGDAQKERPSLDEGWWRSFSDPELDRLVETAFEDNLDLDAAYARLSAAAAGAGVAVSAYIPTVDVQARISNGQQVINFGQGPQSFEQSSLTPQATLSYELDLWGRVNGTMNAAKSELRASRNDLATMYVTVSSNVTDTWLQVIEQRATLALLEEQSKVNSTYLELVELRFRQGLSSALDVFQQRQQAASVKASIPPVKSNLAVLENQLAVLLGRPPGSIEVARASLPELPVAPEVGLPAELLLERPDVRSAQARVVAADHRVASAIAARFPRLTLSASGGTNGFNLAQGILENFFYNLAANLIVPLTDQVRLHHEQKRAEAQMKESVANYGNAVLTAFREVEDALVREARQDDLLVELQEQVDLAHATLREARTRYRNGLSDYLPVLNALQTLQSSEQRLVAAERQRLSLRVQLCRALGGRWASTTAAVPRKEAS